MHQADLNILANLLSEPGTDLFQPNRLFCPSDGSFAISREIPRNDQIFRIQWGRPQAYPRMYRWVQYYIRNAVIQRETPHKLFRTIHQYALTSFSSHPMAIAGLALIVRT